MKLIKLSSLFLKKIFLTSMLVNIVLPITFILSDKVFGLQGQDTNQVSFLSFSFLFNILIIPFYSLIVVSQNLSWLTLLPFTKRTLILFSSLLRLLAFALGVLMLFSTQYLMEWGYYQSIDQNQSLVIIDKITSFEWLNMIEWHAANLSISFMLICLFLSFFFVNFDFEKKNYRLSFAPLVMLLKGSLAGILSVAGIIFVFGLINISNSNLYLAISLILPGTLWITGKIYVVQKNYFRFIKILMILITLVHFGFILKASREIRLPGMSLDSRVKNLEFLGVYALEQNEIAAKILEEMIKKREVSLDFTLTYFRELEPSVLFQILQMSLSLEQLQKVKLYLKTERLDPYFFKPSIVLNTSNNFNESIEKLKFFDIPGLEMKQVLFLVSFFMGNYPEGEASFLYNISLRAFSADEIVILLKSTSRYHRKLGLKLLVTRPEIEVSESLLKEVVSSDPLLYEEAIKVISSRLGSYQESLEILNKSIISDRKIKEECPDERDEYLAALQVKDKLIGIKCFHLFTDGRIQSQFDRLEFYINFYRELNIKRVKNTVQKGRR